MMQRFVPLLCRPDRARTLIPAPFASIYYDERLYIAASDGTVELTVPTTRGGVTASTEVIAAKRHTGVHASVIACKNRIANQQLAYAA